VKNDTFYPYLQKEILMSTERKTEGPELGVEELRQAARQFNLACERLREEIEAVGRQAAELEKQAAAALTQYYHLIGEGDKTGADRALAEIKPIRAKAAQLRSGVGPFIERLAELDRNYTSLNVAIQSRFASEEGRFKEAKVRFNQAATLLGELGSAPLSQVRQLVERWREDLGVEAPAAEPEKAREEEEAIPAGKATMPACPRCRRNDDVVRVGGERFRCRRSYHGPIDFLTSDEELSRRMPGPPAKSDLSIAHSQALSA
jgi:predicted ribosome quality control (RQC) complex YloA/Tae2 family protein